MSARSFYEGRSIFVTGATGFLGKVLVEKLLRDFPSVASIYVLMRATKAETPEERLTQLFKSSIFGVLRGQGKAALFEKVVPIPGDVGREDLGISLQHRQLLSENVSVIFHVAATVRFNEPLHVALQINVEGTRRVIQLGKTIPQLCSLVYVSTAYSNADVDHEKLMVISEKVYAPSLPPDSSSHFISSLQQLHPLTLKHITPALLGKKPNTYTLSKQLGECVAEAEAERCHFPISILRPSIVGPVHSDPPDLPGWTDNVNALGIVLQSVAGGLNYVTEAEPNISWDVIPVDYVVKIIILAAWETGSRVKVPEAENIPPIRVFNACIHEFNGITQGEFLAHLKRAAYKTPFSQILGPPSIKTTRRRKWWWWGYPLERLALTLPSKLFALISQLRGESNSNSNSRMLRTYGNNERAVRTVAFFRRAHFEFESGNVRALRSRIPRTDQDVLRLDLEDVNWEDYLERCVLGLRRYYFHESDSTLPQAINNLTRIQTIYSAARVLTALAILLPLVPLLLLVRAKLRY